MALLLNANFYKDIRLIMLKIRRKRNYLISIVAVSPFGVISFLLFVCVMIAFYTPTAASIAGSAVMFVIWLVSLIKTIFAIRKVG